MPRLKTRGKGQKIRQRLTAKTREALGAISLFSGAGGMDAGFAAAGFEIVLANDIDPVACETFRRNHGDVIVEGDMRALMPLASRLHGIDVVFGGPPCQGFSVAGKMDADDERNRLIRDFISFVGVVRPRAFVCENVKALAFLSRWRRIRERLIQTAEAMDYDTALVILNSADFGVPQARERMFLIGFDKRVFGANPFLKAKLESLLESCKESPPTIRQVVKRLGRAGTPKNSRICKARITYAKVPVLRRSPYAGMLFNGAGRPLPADGFSSTLPASMGGNKTPIVDESEIFDGAASFIEDYHARLMRGGKPSKGDAPKRLRRLTVDECLAIQTFPQGYQLAGSQSAIFRQIGNAVPCKLAEAVARSVAQVLCSDASATQAEDKHAIRLAA